MTQPSARQLLGLFAEARRRSIDLYAASALVELAALPSWPDPADEAASGTLLEALRALLIQERERPRDLHRVSLAITAPLRGAQPSLNDNVRVLLGSAVRELLVIGYSFGDRGFEAALHSAAAKQVAVTIVGERGDRSLRTLLDFWPSTGRRPFVYVGYEPDIDRVFAVHAKVVVADRRRMLAGSANFTASGLVHNFEVGLVTEGAVAEEMCRVVEAHVTAAYLVPLEASAGRKRLSRSAR